MNKSDERFARIERNLEQVTRTLATTQAINAETAKLVKDTAKLAKENEQAMRRLIDTVASFVRGHANGKGKR